MKISELDPLISGFTPTLDLVPVVHAGKTYSMRISDFQLSTEGANFLPTTGGYLSGPLYLYDNPTDPNEAANKAYVDAHVSTDGAFLPITGGSLEGPLHLSRDPLDPTEAVTKSYTDALFSDAAIGGVSVLEYRLRTVITFADPGPGNMAFNNATQEEATMLFIDQVSMAGRDWTNLLLSLRVGQKISIQSIGDHNRVARFVVSGTVLNQTGWTTVPVTPAGATGFPLGNNTDVAIAILGMNTDQWLPLEGGTLTGPLHITHATDANIYVNATGSSWPGVKWNTETDGTAAGFFQSSRKGKKRWAVEFGSTEAETTGTNQGTNFHIRPFNDDGTAQSLIFGLYRSDRHGYMDGAFTFGLGLKNAVTIAPGSNTANAAIISATGTAGISVTSPLYLRGDPSLSLEAVPLGYLQANYAPISGGGYVQKSGDTMSGVLTINATPLTLRSQTGWPSLVFDAMLPSGSAAGFIQANRNGVARWSIELGGAAAESGAATGSPLNIRPFDNLGNALPQIIRAFRDTMAVTFPGGGPVTVGSGSQNALITTPGATAATAITLAASGTAPIRFNGGISFGQRTGGSPSDLSQHISLYDGFGGFSVTGGTINIVSNGNTDFVDGFGNRFVSMNGAGLFMIGATDITLARDPSTAMHATTKQYVDAKFVQATGGDYVEISGDTMTGGLVIDTFASLQQPLTWRTNLIGYPPPADFSGSIGLSYGGMIEVDFFNNMANGSEGTGFTWYQRFPAAVGVQPIMSLRNTGSFYVNRFNPDGTYLGPSLSINPADGRVSIAQNLSVNQSITVGTSTAANVTVNVNAGAQQGTGYQWLIGGNARWFLGTDNYPDENGTDIGSGLTLHRYSDAGGYLGSAFGVNRKTGQLATQGGLYLWNLGIDFGGAVVTNAWDLTKHIQLHYAGYGLSVASFRMNHVAAGDARHYFVIGTTDAASIHSTGISYDGLPNGGHTTGITWFPDSTPHLFIDGIEQGALAMKSAVPISTTDLPYMDGAASAGSNQWIYAQSTHVHPTQLTYVQPNAETSRALSVAEVSSYLLYMWGSPTAPVTLTLPVAATPIKAWAAMNITNQPITLAGASGGTITIQAHGNQAVWTDGGGVYALNVTTPTAAPTSNDDAVANTRWALGKAGGTMSGGLSFGTQTSPTHAGDMSRHIELFNGFGGFSVTGGTINMVSGVDIAFVHSSDGRIRALLNDSGFDLRTGDITLFRDPSTAMHATTKQYVDAKFVQVSGGDYVKKSGDAMTGPLTSNSDITTGAYVIGSVFSARQANGYPQIRFLNTAAGADIKNMILFMDPSGNMGFQFENDAANAATAFFQATRSGYGSASVTLTVPSINLTGAVTASANVSVSAGIVYRGFSSNVIGLGWDGPNACVNQYVDGTFQGTVATRGWVGGNYKAIGAYTPNQDVNYLSSPGFQRVTCEDIMSNVGRMYVAANFNYWMGRNTDGTWMIVDYATAILTLTPSGVLSIPGTASVSGTGIYFKNLGPVAAHAFYFDTGSSVYGRVDGNYQTDYVVGTWSDRRLKQDIVPSTFDCLAAVNMLPLKQYRWRKPSEPRTVEGNVREVDDTIIIPVGLIAQEVGEAFPVGARPGLNGPRGEGWWQLNDQALIAALIGAVQQLTKQNTALAARVEALETRH